MKNSLSVSVFRDKRCAFFTCSLKQFHENSTEKTRNYASKEKFAFEDENVSHLPVVRVSHSLSCLPFTSLSYYFA
jgi:hypothetical protein